MQINIVPIIINMTITNAVKTSYSPFLYRYNNPLAIMTKASIPAVDRHIVPISVVVFMVLFF